MRALPTKVVFKMKTNDRLAGTRQDVRQMKDTIAVVRDRLGELSTRLDDDRMSFETLEGFVETSEMTTGLCAMATSVFGDHLA